ncbi:MAG: helicase-exonuclease AddAB subunit AddA [Clostridiales bacterium]|nr:helicase-exonuclease AddAB subunit AddA [Clostridiales bacterium]
MSDMKWTAQQSEVIDSRGQNILVSAAAGSGKTAVLIERIKTLIIDDKVDVDRFLITTFTNAASAEMKERLEKAFRNEMEKPGADREFLKKQLSLIPRANIGTFHNFALEVMKHYFYLTDLEPGFAICDETRMGIMEKDALDQVMEDRFAEDYDRLKSFLTKYGSDRNENKVKENILALYKELRSIPNYMEWAKERVELYKSQEPLEDLGVLPFLIEETYEALKEAEYCYSKVVGILKDEGLERLGATAERDLIAVRSGLGDMEELKVEWAEGGKLDFDEMAQCVCLPSLTTIRANSEEKERYELCRDEIAKIRKKGKGILEEIRTKLFPMSLEEINEEFISQYDDVVYFIGLVEQFRQKVKGKKNAENVVDFDDAMHYAIEILDDRTAAMEYRSRFEYIFIDEFQDSNMLQEEIISRIAGENNVFMVGDVKQSIYKFRLAEPEIFKEKYRWYALESEANSKKIDLNMNFRSKGSVIDTVNQVFKNVMEDYGENEVLNCGVDRNYSGLQSELHIIDSNKEEHLPEEALVAELIREKLGEVIFDTKREEERRIRYKDVVVLARNKTAIAAIERYLNNEGIPAYGENTGGYFSTVEILVFINILKIIDNTRQDVPLISAMRSVVFDFSIKELAEIRIENRESSFYCALSNYAESGRDEELRDKIDSMFQRISYWRKISRMVPLEDLVRTIMYDTGYYDYCSGLPMGRQRTSNLRLLIEKAAEFEERSFSGLYGFLSYVEALDKNQLNIGEAKVLSDSDDVVRVMTVHKSKGLEFPVVILASAGRSIRGGSPSGSGLVHKDFAITLPVVNKEYLWHKKSYLQTVIARKKAKEQYEEEVRILYVALTRAMDGLLVVGTAKDIKTVDSGEGRRGSFIEMVYDAFAKNRWPVIVHDDSRPKEEGRVAARKSEGELFEKASEAGNREKIEQIHSILDFKYGYEHLGKVKSKYSVTELNTKNHKGRVGLPPLTVPMFLDEKRVLSPSEIGIAMHLVMQKLDFGKALREGREYVDDRIEALCEDGLLTEEEKRAIDPKKVRGFFESEIGRRAAQAEVLEKEREFLMRKEIDGVETIVQGVIDCYFEEDGEIVLIDYKNSYLGMSVSEEQILQRYREQLVIYREALEASTGKNVKEAYLYLFGADAIQFCEK